MRFLFKTSYDQDIDLFKHNGQRFWYGLLLLVLLLVGLPEAWLAHLPGGLQGLWPGSYGIAQLSLMLIYSVVGLGLMLLAGYTGLFSMGHAGLLGVGAYAQALMNAQGWPFFLTIPMAGLLAAAVGVVVALPSLRVKGIYLAIATLSFGFIIEEVFARWQSLTGGNAGLLVQRPQAFGWTLSDERSLYFLCLAVTVLSTLCVVNLLRSPIGRSFVAVRDSEVSAQCMGIHLARTKTLAFAVSALLAGVGGALYAHFITFLTPDSFGVLHSIDLLLLVTIGGLGSVHGAFFGAVFLVAAPQLIAQGKDFLPEHIAQAPGLKQAVYGLVLIAFVMFEPRGLYGRWLKVRTWLQLFPFYRRGLLARQKSYQKSERLR
jgi:branched-chain amino acid transport system permease protein